jgi:hypothetical protein
MVNSNPSGNLEVKLVGRTGPYRGNSYIFRENELLIGRVQGCDLLMVENTISAQHARIMKVGDRYEIEDLRSTNGTFVNGIKIDRKVLRSGDKIKFDQMEFEFVNPADVSRTMMATPGAMADLGRTIVRPPQQPSQPAPAPAYVPTASPAPTSARRARGSLLGGVILGAIVGLVFAYLVYLVVIPVQRGTGGEPVKNATEVLKSWAGTFPGMHTHVAWKTAGIRTVTGAAVLIALLLAPVLGGLVAQAIGKRSRARTAFSFSLLYVLAAVAVQLISIGFKVKLWLAAFPALATSYGAWGNLAVSLAYFFGVVFVLSLIGAHFVQRRKT